MTTVRQPWLKVGELCSEPWRAGCPSNKRLRTFGAVRNSLDTIVSYDQQRLA